MIYGQLIWEFFKIGLFAVGGGLASLPFLYDLAARSGWFSNYDLVNMVAIAESTPGPLGINMATYVGFQVAGLGGGVVASLALAMPSLIIAGLICRFVSRFRQNDKVKAAFSGLRPAVAGLILAMALNLLFIVVFGGAIGQKWLLDAHALIFFAIILGLIMFFKQHPAFYIAVGAIVGVIFKL